MYTYGYEGLRIVVGNKGMVKLLPTLKSGMIKFTTYMRNVFGYKGIVKPLPTLKRGMIDFITNLTLRTRVW